MTAAEQTWTWLEPMLPELADTSQPWDERRQRALEMIGLSQPEQHPATHELFQHLDGLADEERDALGQDGLSQLAYDIVVRTSDQQPADPAGPDGADGGGYDESVWLAFLAENGPAWNGTEEAWQPFREWFAYLAGERGVHQPANALLDYLDPMPAEDRIGALAQYGVVIAAPAASAAGGEQEGGEDEADEDDDEMADELAELLSGIEGIEDMSEEEIEQIVSATLEGGNQ